MFGNDMYYERQQDLWDIQKGVEAAEDQIVLLMGELRDTGGMLDYKAVENRLLKAQVALTQLNRNIENTRSDLQIDDMLDELMLAEADLGELRSKVKTQEEAIELISTPDVDGPPEDWPGWLMFEHGQRVYDQVTKLSGWIVGWEFGTNEQVFYTFETVSGARIDAPTLDLLDYEYLYDYDDDELPQIEKDNPFDIPFGEIDQEKLELERAGYYGDSWEKVYEDQYETVYSSAREGEDDDEDDWWY